MARKVNVGSFCLNCSIKHMAAGALLLIAAQALVGYMSGQTTMLWLIVTLAAYFGVYLYASNARASD